jgi:hypothetical protein
MLSVNVLEVIGAVTVLCQCGELINCDEAKTISTATVNLVTINHRPTTLIFTV